MRDFFLNKLSPVIKITHLRGNLSTITDIVLSFYAAIGVRSCFFFLRNIHFFLRLCSLTVRDDSCWSRRGQRALSFFAMVSNAIDTL